VINHDVPRAAQLPHFDGHLELPAFFQLLQTSPDQEIIGAMKARLITTVVDLLLDWISLLIRDDTPATVATTFQELAQLLSGNIRVGGHDSDPSYETAAWRHSNSADNSLFDPLRCSSQNQPISLCASSCPQTATIIRLIEAETGSNNG
jgi:hypothetical protein